MNNFIKDFFSLSPDNEVTGTSPESRAIKMAFKNSETRLDPLVAQGLSPIDKLNDDCLRLVFQYLPIFDKVRIESVCKRWRSLSKESWYTFKRLDLSSLTWGWTDKTKNLNLETIELICQLCTNMQALNLTDVEIDQMRTHRFMSRKRRYMFLRACEQRRRCEHPTLRECEREFCFCELAEARDYEHPIDSAQLSEEEVHEMMEALISCCHNLTKFGMGMRYLGYSSEDLFKLFDKMKNVKELRLTTVQGISLTHLSFDTIEELFLGACNGIYPDHLCNVIEKFQKLNTLVLDTCRYIDDLGMLKLLSQAGTLKNLGLIGGSHSLSARGIKCIPQLIHLEKLNIKGNSLVDDEFLEALAVKCEQLTYLNISCCEKVTNNGVLSISTLPHLQHLIISQLTCVSDRFLGRIHNLRVLDCQYCPRMSDEGLGILVERSPELRILILEGCKLVTEKLLDVAVEATESRSNNVVLKISINSNASPDITKFNQASPLLRVVSKITRQESRRMDFKDEYFPIEEDNFVTSEFSNTEIEKFISL
ncbi:F-box/LRR-repeat protein 7-like isoform X2 [Belonocnema kinseyi]|uniref:F-box/LRR-repeat protein 7-like isoform X2 n=1 Tax=Belonocnema kinseyi TaxID=2817044 RepID=UPI00143CC69C|nr:F-box/LRR-repeat protein 7-like isoform X2 [Belonocnema kinseyi]